MIKSPQRQGSFYDAEYICEKLVPKDSFYRKFKEFVDPLIKDADFGSMYCHNNGRPPISPSLLVKAMIIQFYRNYSDREMERACMYDIEIKYALGLQLDERPFDHSSLSDFRKRLLENEKEKLIFDTVLNKLIESDLIKKDEAQRIDATHIIADVAIPSMVMLVKKGVREVLKSAKGQKRKIYDDIAKEINIDEYGRKKVNIDFAGRWNIEKKKKKIVEVVEDARAVLNKLEGFKPKRELRKRIGFLQRILQENIEEDRNGDPKEIEPRKKQGNLLVSPIDEDARYGAKSRTKRFMGYKANITESIDNKFITNIKAMRGNQRDGDDMVEIVTEQKSHGLVPKKIIADSAYSDGIYRKALKENGVQVVAPLKNKDNSGKDVFPKRMFKYDEKKGIVTCPQGVTTNARWDDRQRKTVVYHFPMTKCKVCKVKNKCTKAKEGRRTIGISPVHWELREAEIYNDSQQFKDDMKLRPLVEGKLSELVRYHGFRRARYRGLKKLNLQCYFTALAVNIKRWFKIVMGKLKPDKRIAVSF